MIFGLRFVVNKEKTCTNYRLMSDRGEVAYFVTRCGEPCAEIEFPSDWSDHKLAWVRLSFGLGRLAFTFPWPWVSEDHYQCSGHIYGFTYFDGGVHVHWGKCKGKRNDPFTIIYMPWVWNCKSRKETSKEETFSYTYTLKSGEVQHTLATIHSNEYTYTRPWLPFKKTTQFIKVSFDSEVGERTGSWKGGCTGCSYPMLEGETPLTTLRRMERERTF